MFVKVRCVGPSAVREIADLGKIVDWITAQTWSNGKVGAYGVSTDGSEAKKEISGL